MFREARTHEAGARQIKGHRKSRGPIPLGKAGRNPIQSHMRHLFIIVIGIDQQMLANLLLLIDAGNRPRLLPGFA